MNMDFVIEKTGLYFSRIGRLLNVEKSVSLRTPVLIQCTKAGCIPHLSNETFKYLANDIQILVLSLPTINHMVDALKDYKWNLSTFFGHKQSLNILTTKDVCEQTPCGFNEGNTVPLFTRRGKLNLSANDYMDLVEVISPDIFVSLYDADTNVESSTKRILKSVSRSSDFLNYCYERYMQSKTLSKTMIFASIVGGYDKSARSKSINHVNQKPNIAGYFLDGFHNGGWNATKINAERLLDIVLHCVKELDSSKPRIMLGAYNPLIVIELIKLGIDVFDTSYAYIAAMNFKALVFSFDVSKKTLSGPLLDMTDESNKEDFNPILNGCGCFSCGHYTRAYIYHLYATKELLGPTLLIIHNIHHYMEFFKVIRLSILDDNIDGLCSYLKREYMSIFTGC